MIFPDGPFPVVPRNSLAANLALLPGSDMWYSLHLQPSQDSDDGALVLLALAAVLLLWR